jgi:hypothetical protein
MVSSSLVAQEIEHIRLIVNASPVIMMNAGGAGCKHHDMQTRYLVGAGGMQLKEACGAAFAACGANLSGCTIPRSGSVDP